MGLTTLFAHSLLSPVFADLDDFESEILGGLEEPSSAEEKKAQKKDPGKLQDRTSSEPAALQKRPAQNSQSTKPKESTGITQPIDWSAATLKVSNTDGTIELTADVVIIQGGLKLTSQKAFIYFLPSREVDRIEMLGEVKAVKVADAASDTRMSASSDKAFFYNRSQTVVLQGRASLNRIQDEVRGEIITYELNTGWITVKKVEGVVGSNPNEEKTFAKKQMNTPSPSSKPSLTTKNSSKAGGNQKPVNSPSPGQSSRPASTNPLVETIGGSDPESSPRAAK